MQNLLTKPANEKSGFSQIRLARMHESMRRHVENGHTPGVVTLVHHRGNEYVDAVGTMAFNSSVPMRDNAIFRLASMTKPITAVAALILLEECKIRLDDPVDEWLPELKGRRVLKTIDSALDQTVPAKRSISVRDLMTFRSGYGELGFIAPTSPLQKALAEARLPLSVFPFAESSDEFMKRLGELPLACQPGEKWLYHMSSEILGVLIARVCGKSLGSFLHERIFEPLGMDDTGFYVPEPKIERLPTCYGSDMFTGKLVVLDEARNGWTSQAPKFEGGGGGLVSTARDMAAFGKMLLNGGVYGKKRVLSRLSVELMTTDQLTLEQKAISPFFPSFWDDHGWGMGVSVVTNRTEIGGVPGRFGWDGAFGTSWFVDPKEQMVGVLMTQRRPEALAYSPLVRDFWTSAYQLIDD